MASIGKVISRDIVGSFIIANKVSYPRFSTKVFINLMMESDLQIRERMMAWKGFSSYYFSKIIS